MKNLLREGIDVERIKLVGDVMYDAALYYGAKAERESRILERLGLRPREYLLATVHRAENTDDPERLGAILEALALLHREIPVVFPVHPRTRKRARAFGLERFFKELLALDPVGYLDMLMLEKNARLIATDSGGVQKEAFFFRVPCAILREETEWPELVELGWCTLVPPQDKEAVRYGLTAIQGALGREGTPYGEGRAGTAVAFYLLHQGVP